MEELAYEQFGEGMNPTYDPRVAIPFGRPQLETIDSRRALSTEVQGREYEDYEVLPIRSMRYYLVEVGGR